MQTIYGIRFALGSAHEKQPYNRTFRQWYTSCRVTLDRSDRYSNALNHTGASYHSRNIRRPGNVPGAELLRTALVEIVLPYKAGDREV